MWITLHRLECVCAKLLQLCPMLCNPMDCSLLGSSVHGIFQARILEWVAMPSSRGSSQFGIEPACLTIPALASSFFTTSATWDAPLVRMAIIKKSTCRKGWRGCGERGTPVHRGGNVNWYIHHGKQYGGSLKD